MGVFLGFLASLASVVLNVVSTLDIGTTSVWYFHQPRAPKSLLK